MRIAHLIMAHKNPQQLWRLVNVLQHQNADIFIHVDKKVDVSLFITGKLPHNVYFIRQRTKCNWGGFNFLKATFTSLQEILNSGKLYSFFNLLSAQDYPLVSAEKLFNFYALYPNSSFISFDEDAESEWMVKAKERYLSYHLTDVPFRGKYFLQKIINLIIPKKKLPSGYKFYGSANASWWTLSNECVIYLVQKYQTGGDGFFRFIKYSWGSDEFAIPTLLLNSSHRDKLINNNFRYIDWSEGKARPKTLTLADKDKLYHSQMLFARKFDTEVDEIILDVIDEKIKSGS
ncbi:Core-2/I-Branching enzyme [bacterium A37T11]|nr:Core-2/I-Branching enzyme [bacterium A37T11]